MKEKLRKLFLFVASMLFAGVAAFLWQKSSSMQSLQGEVEGPIVPYCSAIKVNSIMRLALDSQKKVQGTKFERGNRNLSGASLSAQALRVEWDITEPKLGEADPIMVQRLASILCNLKRAEKIENPDYEKLGLKNPALRVLLTLKNKEQLSERLYSFGETVSKNRVAMSFQDSSSQGTFVVSVPEQVKKIAAIAAEKFRNRRLVKMPIGSMDFVKVSYRGKEKFSLERAGSRWELVGPKAIKTKKIDPLEANKFVNRIGTLKAVSILNVDYSAKDCVASKNSYEMEIEGIGRKKERLLFRLGKKGKVIEACSNARRALLGVHPDMRKYLTIKNM